MSGHSKWATTKRAKAATDAKRAVLFTKLAKAMTVAARQKGGDPETNFSLRLAIDKAKAANMPRENIDRAIKRGTGELQGAAIEELIYEGRGPGGTALIIKCLTDNKNRSAQEVKHVLTKHGGSLASPNAVMWQFAKKGVIRLENEQIAKKTPEELELMLIDLGADDITKETEGLIVFSKVENLQKIKKGLENSGLIVEYAEIEFVPKEKITLDPELTKKNEELFEELDATEDVDDYYTNLNY
jgi:YebC/PmpR family DNA-binding regulatory protein